MSVQTGIYQNQYLTDARPMNFNHSSQNEGKMRVGRKLKIHAVLLYKPRVFFKIKKIKSNHWTLDAENLAGRFPWVCAWTIALCVYVKICWVVKIYRMRAGSDVSALLWGPLVSFLCIGRGLLAFDNFFLSICRWCMFWCLVKALWQAEILRVCG